MSSNNKTSINNITYIVVHRWHSRRYQKLIVMKRRLCSRRINGATSRTFLFKTGRHLDFLRLFIRSSLLTPTRAQVTKRFKGARDSREQHICTLIAALVRWILAETLVKLLDLLLVDSSSIVFVLFSGFRGGYYVMSFPTPPLYPPPQCLCLLEIICLCSRQYVEISYPITSLIRKYSKKYPKLKWPMIVRVSWRPIHVTGKLVTR